MRSLKNKEGKIIKPYSYQKVSYRLLINALQKHGRALMVKATGLGKTITSIFVLLHFLKSKNRVLFLCHDTGILDQAYENYKEFLGDVYSFTKFYGKKKDWEADAHNFVFATFQSMGAHLFNKNGKKRIFPKKHFDYVIVDEGHHAKAGTYEPVLKYFAPQWKLSMTATPEREDEKDITQIFGKPTVRIDLPEAIAKRWLTPVDYRVLSDGLNEELIQKLVAEVLEENIRITEKQINERIFVRVRTQEQVKEILKESKRKQAIVFCENITHLHHMAEFLPQSVWVHSHQTGDENKEAMEAFKKKKARHILVVDKFNEGIDIPDVELLVFLRGTDSRRIFLQQLGRGLRIVPGKKKVTVLDFVGNIRRINEVKELIERIEGFLPKRGNRESDRFIPLHVEGTGFSFKFTSQITDLLKVFERGHYNRNHSEIYSTWQEASKAAIRLGIKDREEYKKRYREDQKLSSDPAKFYPNFPGYPVFLGTARNYYPTWQKASKVTIKLGIKDREEYKKRYREDPRLCSNPNRTYPNFPGYIIFFGGQKKDFYTTWQKASKATKKLDVKGWREYKKRYREDPKLPSDPEKFYPNFPGYPVFLGVDKYSTWQEASKAAIRLGIAGSAEYGKRWREDPRLPSTPSEFYSNFPGYPIFLGKKK